MADYEVLELLLGYGLTRKDTKPLAKELIQRFGSIRGALDARPEELLEVPALPEYKCGRRRKGRHGQCVRGGAVMARKARV